jgi:hypothetical protein
MKNIDSKKFRSLRVMILIPFLITSCGKGIDDKIGEEAASISVAELRDHMFYLASDELEGRMPGERGYAIAAEYGSTQFRQAGLAPVCLDAEGKKTYLQQVRLIKRIRGEKSKLQLKSDSEINSLRFGDDFFFQLSGDEERVELSDSMVFAGYGIHEPDFGWDDYKDIDVTGKWVIYMFGSPTKDGKSVLPEGLSESYANPMEGYQRKGNTAKEAGALGVVVIYNQERFQMWDILRHATRIQCSLPGHNRLFHTLCDEVFINQEPLKQLFKNRPYDPITEEGDYKSFAMDDVILSLEAQISSEEIQSANVVAMVEGTDPKLKEEYITVGAHLDHVGRDGSTIFNGADDDASGCVAVMEAAEAVALNPPKRSVIFILYTGEELFFMGSQHFVMNPPVPLEQIVLNINLDMVGRPDGEAEDLAVNVGIDKDSTLKDLINSVNKRNTNLSLDYSYDKYFLMSDHVAYHLSGIPVVFFHNGDHEDLHKASDDAEKIDYEFLRKASQLTYFLIMELANGKGEK